MRLVGQNSEGEKELSAKITLKVANSTFEGKQMAELIRPFTPIFIYATMDGDKSEEVIRGTVTNWQLVETNREFYLQLETSDEAQALRKNQDQLFFSDDHGSKKILEEILGKWGVPHEIQIQDVKHSKKVYRKKYLCDMIADVLKDLKEKGGGVYFVRAKGGVIQIIPRGTNEIVYHFDTEDNLVRVQESFDVSQIVTRVQVVGKSKEEGHQKIEATESEFIRRPARDISLLSQFRTTPRIKPCALKSTRTKTKTKNSAWFTTPTPPTKAVLPRRLKGKFLCKNPQKIRNLHTARINLPTRLRA